jgi:hypothetical protein
VFEILFSGFSSPLSSFASWLPPPKFKKNLGDLGYIGKKVRGRKGKKEQLFFVERLHSFAAGDKYRGFP